jgi:hypothetical protein
MYELLKGSAQAAITSIQALISEQRRTGRTDELVLCHWRGDPQLNEVVSNIKVLSRRLSRDCTKLVLVGVNNPSPNELGSLIGEMLAQIDEYASYFINAFGSCSVSSHLFVLVATPVAFMLDQVVELANALAAGQFQKAPQVAGAILETAEMTIDKNLPTTNKVAYRRCLMSKVCQESSHVLCALCVLCLCIVCPPMVTESILIPHPHPPPWQIQGLKEGIQEFRGYMTKSAAFLAAEGGDAEEEGPEGGGANEEEDDSMDDFGDLDDLDEGTYTAEEMAVMQSCIALLVDTQEVVKLCLDGITEVADALTPLTPASAGAGVVSCTVFDDVESATGMAAISAAEDSALACREWVSRVVRCCEQIELASVNFGAELYSPLENVRNTQYLYAVLKTALLEALGLLTRGAQATTVTSGTVYRNLYSPATSAALDQQNVNALSSSLTGLTM